MWCKALIKAALRWVFFFWLWITSASSNAIRTIAGRWLMKRRQAHIYTHTPTHTQGRNCFPEPWDVWEILMKAARVATNEEDGPSVKQNDEKQLSEGDVTLPFLSPFISVCVLSPSRKHTQTHTYTNPAATFINTNFKAPLVKNVLISPHK